MSLRLIKMFYICDKFPFLILVGNMKTRWDMISQSNTSMSYKFDLSIRLWYKFFQPNVSTRYTIGLRDRVCVLMYYEILGLVGTSFIRTIKGFFFTFIGLCQNWNKTQWSLDYFVHIWRENLNFNVMWITLYDERVSTYSPFP